MRYATYLACACWATIYSSTFGYTQTQNCSGPCNNNQVSCCNENEITGATTQQIVYATRTPSWSSRVPLEEAPTASTAAGNSDSTKMNRLPFFHFLKGRFNGSNHRTPLFSGRFRVSR